MPIKLNGSTSGYVQIDAPAVAGTTQITLPATTGGSFIVSDSSGNVAVGANLTLSGTAARITGDFSTATIANRVMLQTSTVNGSTAVGAIPNGTSTTSTINAYNNSDPTNSSFLQIQANVSAAILNSSLLGTGSYLPMAFYTGGSERMRLDTSGNLQVGGTTVANTVGYVNSRTNTRAWVNFTGVTTASVTASYNVSSVTRNATGDYTLNFTTSLADSNYIWLGYAERNTPNKQYNNDAFYENSKSTSALNLKITVVGSLSTEDTPRAYVAIFGN